MLFYKRNVTPVVNLVDHARGLGIHLKSNRLTSSGNPQKGVPSPRSRTATLTTRNAKSSPTSVVGTQYIEDVVVPVSNRIYHTSCQNLIVLCSVLATNLPVYTCGLLLHVTMNING